MSLSSLLRDDGMTIAAVRSDSISSGRRGSSGQPRRTDRTSTGSLAPPTTAGLRRAAWRHHCRSAAGALAPSPVSLPRVATASLLTSSMPPQLGEHLVTGRAGWRRTARRSQPPLKAAMVKWASNEWLTAAAAVRSTPQGTLSRLGETTPPLALAPGCGICCRFRLRASVVLSRARATACDGDQGNEESDKHVAQATIGGAPWPTPQALLGTAGGGSRTGRRYCQTALAV